MTENEEPKVEQQQEAQASTDDQNIAKSGLEDNQQSNEDPNWKAFREARKRERAEKEAVEKRLQEREKEVEALKAAMEAAFSKSSPTPQSYQQYYGTNTGYDYIEETEEQKIERKVNELIAKREEQAARERQEREHREFPNRLAKDFPDFKHVCSQENLDYIDYHFPEISRPLQRLPDGYDKWADVYHAVKKLIPNYANAKKEASRADINSQKPRSMSSPGPSPSGERPVHSWQEMERRRADNWARMQRALKGID